jgi:hypothetical protein
LIAIYNNFTFICSTLSDLWEIDCCIPLKDRYVIEFIRCAVLWVVWLERNKLCFTNQKRQTVAMLGSHILSLAKHWCTCKGKVDLLKLSLVLPQDVDALMQVPVVPVEVPPGVELDGSEEEVAGKNSLWDKVDMEDLLLCGNEIEG